MGKKFVRNATGMVGPNQPKRDSIPNDVKFSNKAEGIFSGVTIAWELAGHRLVGGEQLLLHYLFSFLFFFPFTCSSAFISTCKFSHFCLSGSLPPPHWRKVSEQLCSAYLPTGAKAQQLVSFQWIFKLNTLIKYGIFSALWQYGYFIEKHSVLEG